jgi:hypothetical protein
VGTTNALKDGVYAVARQAVNFFHEVLMLVINWASEFCAVAGRKRSFSAAGHGAPSGGTAEGVAWVEEGIKDWRALGSTLIVPYWLGLKAEVLYLRIVSQRNLRPPGF